MALYPQNIFQYQIKADVISPSVLPEGNEAFWHQGWSNPINRRTIAAALLAPAIAFAPFVTAPPETITVDKWFKELSTPVRFPPALRTGLQQTTAYTNATPVTDDLEPRWHYPWSEPVRFKPNLGAPRQQAFFAEPFGLTQPEQVLYSKFAFQWSEPVRFKPRLATGLQQFLALHPTPSPFVASGWFNWLSEPARSPLMLKAGLQQTAAYVNATPTTDSIEARWHYPWSEPVRFKPALKAGLHQTLAFNPVPVVPFGWDEALSEPPRFPRRLLPGLSLFNSLPFPIIPTPATLGIQGWYTPWSEPVRFPQGLKAYLQQSAAMPPRLLPNPDITGILHASDTPDTFLAAGSSFNQVSSAEVGIIELSGLPANVGIIEITQLSANVGQVSDVTSQQSGTVTAVTSAANVSIREI